MTGLGCGEQYYYSYRRDCKYDWNLDMEHDNQREDISHAMERYHIPHAIYHLHSNAALGTINSIFKTLTFALGKYSIKHVHVTKAFFT